MTLSKPEDMDDVEQPENSESDESDESDGGEQTVMVEWDKSEMPISAAVVGHSAMLMDVQNWAAKEAEVAELKATVLEQREMLNELTAAIELLSGELNEAGIGGVSLEMDLRDRPASFGDGR